MIHKIVTDRVTNKDRVLFYATAGTTPISGPGTSTIHAAKDVTSIASDTIYISEQLKEKDKDEDKEKPEIKDNKLMTFIVDNNANEQQNIQQYQNKNNGNNDRKIDAATKNSKYEAAKRFVEVVKQKFKEWTAKRANKKKSNKS